MLEALIFDIFGRYCAEMSDAIVCGEDVQRKKPDPEVYGACLARLGVKPGAALDMIYTRSFQHVTNLRLIRLGKRVRHRMFLLRPRAGKPWNSPSM
jgi:Haloacid dehalogenase-like hydrolase